MVRARLLCVIVVLWACLDAHPLQASGPHWVAGVNYFDATAKGTPVVWAGGTVRYFLDQGALSSTVSNSVAAQGIAEAAAVWNAVPTAAVSITQGGSLSEDVSGSNVTANSPAGTGATLPSDAQPSATDKPVAIVLDEDGSVIDDIYGPGASDASECAQNGVYTTVDNFATAGTIAHALIVVNGLCATSTANQGLLIYQMIRAFGRVLGLDWSQVNDAMWQSSTPTTEGLAGWPLMHPLEYLCTGTETGCMPNPTSLRPDDIASLNQLYPVTSANAGTWSGKTITASATVTVTGTVSFAGGQGMQGVNVMLTPVVNGTPEPQYAVSAVTGAYFARDAGSAITGATDAQGNLYGRFGSDDPALEGYYAASGIPLPPGATSVTYQVAIEAVNPLYTGFEAVGPYGTYSQVAISGAAQSTTLGPLAAGGSSTQNFVLMDSAVGTATGDGEATAPAAPGGTGQWQSRVTGYGHTGWFALHARANRLFTVEALALDAQSHATATKTGVLIGLWQASDALDAVPDLATTAPFNGAVAGLTTIEAQTPIDEDIRIAYADVRGDGRPDFSYRGRVLYADTVSPARLTLNGGAVVIDGEGFVPGMEVTLNGVAAAVTGVTPTQITAVAAPVSAPTGTVVVAVRDPQTLGLAEILDGLSYDAQGSDGLRIIHAPSGTVAQGVPIPLTVQAVGADAATPAANVAVTFAVTAGSATLGCGNTCSVLTNASGYATVAVTATGAQASQVTASIASGASVAAEFDGGAPPQIAATNALYVAAGARVTWQPAALVLSGGNPLQGATVQWAGSPGAVSGSATSTTSAAGVATTSVVAGPLAANGNAVVNACQPSSTVCVPFTEYGEDSAQANLLPVTGTGQSLAVGQTPSAVTLEAIDGVGHAFAGVAVTVYQAMTAWEPPCPATGLCPPAQLLGTSETTLTSDANGSCTFVPMTAPAGEPVVIRVLAAAGSQASISWQIVEHP